MSYVPPHLRKQQQQQTGSGGAGDAATSTVKDHQTQEQEEKEIATHPPPQQERRVLFFSKTRSVVADFSSLRSAGNDHLTDNQLVPEDAQPPYCAFIKTFGRGVDESTMCGYFKDCGTITRCRIVIGEHALFCIMELKERADLIAVLRKNEHLKVRYHHPVKCLLASRAQIERLQQHHTGDITSTSGDSDAYDYERRYPYISQPEKRRRLDSSSVSSASFSQTSSPPQPQDDSGPDS